VSDDVDGIATTPSVKSAERALRVLEVLATVRRAQFTDLKRELGMPKSSLHALLTTMTSLGWITSDRKGAFSLGYRARAIGIAGLGDSNVVVLTDDLMDDLRDAVDETVHLARLDGRDVLYLASKYSRHALNVHFEVGRRLPAYVTALGKAMLAELPDESVATHLPDVLSIYTPKTIHSARHLHGELALVRERGFAEDDEESAIGLRCFAVALRHPDVPLIAVSCSVPVARLSSEREREIVNSLLELRGRFLTRLRPLSIENAG
jgi:DNA-binding IclR family transcriptional regulator